MNVSSLASARYDMGERILLIFDRPKDLFSDPASTDLLNNLQHVTENAFGVERRTAKSLEGLRDHVMNVDLLGIVFTGNDTLGFASVRCYVEHDLCYLHGITVRTDIKMNGVGKWVLTTMFRRSGLKQMAFTTQNPVMFCLLRRLFLNVWPSPEAEKVPLIFHELGCKLMASRQGKFDVTTFIASDLYTNCLYPQLPVTSNTMINQWFERSLNANEGITHDGFLFIANGFRE